MTQLLITDTRNLQTTFPCFFTRLKKEEENIKYQLYAKRNLIQSVNR